MRTKTPLSHIACGVVVGAVVLLTHGAVADAAPIPHVSARPAIAQVSQSLHRAAPLGASRLYHAVSHAVPLSWCNTCGGDGGGNGGGGSGGTSCNKSLELAQVNIYDHATSDGTVTLFENTCASPKLVWAHTWDAYSFSNFSASLTTCNSGSSCAQPPLPPSSGSQIWCAGFGLPCATDTTQQAVSPGAQYMACGTQNNFYACTGWITPQ